MLTEDGTIVWRGKQQLWGREEGINKEDAPTCRLRFPGQYEDEESGLYYNRFRYYDCRAGYSVVRGKKGELWYISADGKRIYRSPTPKSSDYAKTGKQANFHERGNVNDNWWDTQRVSNVHVHVE
ncbi:hypothetical protein WAC87_003135 [Shigella flexneri]